MDERAIPASELRPSSPPPPPKKGEPLRRHIKQLLDENQRLRNNRNRYRERLAVMKRTTYASLAANVALLIVAIVMLILAWNKNALGAPGTDTPDYVLASVHMSNGNSCSGTVVYDPNIKHENALIVSCAHCVAGNIGNECWWHNPDGTAFKAKLVAFDRKHDLSLFITARKNTLYGVPIVDTWDQATAAVTVCGYPRGKGPKKRDAYYAGESRAQGSMDRWLFTVKERPYIIGGDSGCGVFIDGRLMGVLSHRKKRYSKDTEPNPTLLCTPASNLKAFMDANCKGLAGCPPWGCPRPGTNPYTNRDGTNNDEQGPVAPPPPRFDPNPNVNIQPPRRNDKERDVVIEQLVSEIESLKDQVADLSKRKDDVVIGAPGEPGPPGPAGPPGPQGEPGSNGDADVSRVERELEILRKNLETLTSTVRDNTIGRGSTDLEIQRLKDGAAIAKKAVDELVKKQRDDALAIQDMKIEMQRMQDRVGGVEKKLSGTIQFKVRAQPESE